MFRGFDRTPFSSLDVKIWATKGDQRARQRVYWLQQKSLQCGRTLQGFQRFGTQLVDRTVSKCKRCYSTQLHDIRMLSLFNFWQSLSRHQPDLSLHDIIYINRADFLSFSAVLNDFSTSVSQIHRGVQSVSDLVPDPLLHLEKIHFCQDEHEKRTLSPPEIDSIGCLFKLKRIYVYVQYRGAAESGVMFL